MLSLILVLSVASASQLEEANKSFEEALYEETLAKLPGACASWEAEAWECERLRALSAVAVGQEALAVGAFARMALLNPAQTEAAEVDLSPTRRGLLGRGRDLANGVEALRLDEVAGNLEPESWHLELTNIASSLPTIVGVVANVAAAEGEGWHRHELRLESGRVVSDPADYGVDPGVRRYYLVVDLGDYGVFDLGNRDHTRDVRFVSLFETTQFGAVTDPWPRQQKRGQVEDNSVSWWYIAAGAVAVVAAGVLVGMLVAKGDETAGAPAKQ